MSESRGSAEVYPVTDCAGGITLGRSPGRGRLAARDGRSSPLGDNLREQIRDGKPDAGLKGLARALAAIDGRGSAETVLDAIATPGGWDQYICLDAPERLLMAGVVLPTTTVLALVDSIFERTEQWMQESDRHLLRRVLALCPFVDDPAAGIAKMCDVLDKRRLRGYELRELVTALGESRSDAAIDLLDKFATDAQTNRCVVTPRRWLCHQPLDRYAAHLGSAQGRCPITTAAKGLYPPFGSRIAIRSGGLSQAARQTWADRLDEPAWQPLRERYG